MNFLKKLFSRQKDSDTAEKNYNEAEAKAQQEKVIHLTKLDQFDLAIECCDAFLQKHPAKSSDPVLNGNLAWFLSQKGALLANKGEFEKAIIVFDEVLHRFGESNDIVCRISSALSLRVKAGCLRALDRYRESAEVDIFLASKFIDDPEPRVRWHLENPLYPPGDS